MGSIHQKVKPILKGRQHIDEKYIPMKNGKDHYDLNCIDHKTKYVTAHLFVEKRTLSKCVEFLKQVKITCYEQILVQYKKEKHKPYDKRKLILFVSDGFENYYAAWAKLFWRVSKMTHGTPIKAKVAGLEHNNNPIERYNGKIKDRIKTMRGGFGSFEGAEVFMNMNHTIHNFVNPHQGIKGKTPAEAAGIDLSLGENKIMNLIQKMAKETPHSRR